MEFQVCTVDEAGPAANPALGPGANPALGPSPVINVHLSILTGAWTKNWFFVHEDLRREALAVALAAISSQRRVFAIFDPPNPGNDPYTKLYGLYLRSGWD